MIRPTPIIAAALASHPVNAADSRLVAEACRMERDRAELLDMLERGIAAATWSATKGEPFKAEGQWLREARHLHAKLKGET